MVKCGHGLAGSIPNLLRMPWARWRYTMLHCLQNKAKACGSLAEDFASHTPSKRMKRDGKMHAFSHTDAWHSTVLFFAVNIHVWISQTNIAKLSGSVTVVADGSL